MQGNLQSGGRLVAVGDVNGSVSLLEVCDGLATSQANEKNAILSAYLVVGSHCLQRRDVFVLVLFTRCFRWPVFPAQACLSVKRSVRRT